MKVSGGTKQGVIVSVLLVVMLALGAGSVLAGDGKGKGALKEKAAAQPTSVVIPLATQAGTVVQVTNNGNYSYQHDWIDNTWIVYHLYSNDTLYKTDGVVNTAISDPLDNYDCDSHPDANAAGTVIAFQRNVDTSLTDCASLWVMDTNGGNQRELVSCDPDVGGAHQPKWSPDGKYIAFTQGLNDHDYKELAVVEYSATSRMIPKIVTSAMNNPHNGLQWMPSASRRGGPGILASLRDWGSDSYWSSHDWGRNIASVSLGGVTTWLTSRGVDDYCEMTPVPTVNGKIVYMSDQNNYGDIWIMNPDGTNKVQLTDTGASGYCNNHPEPHPSGKYIAYRCEDPAAAGARRICMMTADGLHKGIVVNDSTVTSWNNAILKFNAAGTRLLYSGCGGSCYPYELFTLNLDTADSDGDLLKNWEEVIYGTNLLLADTDGGGESDGAEAAGGRDPLNPADDRALATRR